jgi:hypothetical protein
MALKDSYQWNATDLPTYTVTLEWDGHKHEIVDYAGRQVGMPATVTEFEWEIDRVLQEAMQRRLSAQGLAQLASDGFDFDTPAGLALLERAINASSAGEAQDLLSLYDRLSPMQMRKQSAPAQKLQERMFYSAIAQGRAPLLMKMLSRGALRKAGQYEKDQIDGAFYMAVVSGRPDLVAMLWQLPDQAPHPSLQYEEERWAPAKSSKRVPLTLALGSDPTRRKDGNDFKIAKFLVEKGCDPSATGANGQTLLHIATASDDVAFVRYVLGLGVKASMPGPYDLPAVAGAQNEDVAMALLEAGMIRKEVRKIKGVRPYCKDRKWSRVLAWLDAYPR